jgi:hypothetical protein
MANGNFDLTGYYDTQVVYDRINKQWKIQLLSDPSVYAFAPGSEPPIGTHLFNSSLGNGHFWANINACNDSREFNCADGKCIPIEQRYKYDFFKQMNETLFNVTCFSGVILKVIARMGQMKWIVTLYK